MNDVALSILLLCIIAVLGLGLGGIKVKGIRLGVGGVMFGGILVGHVVHQLGIRLNPAPLAFLQEFGLILFVYTIGVQVGPGFFAALKRAGLALNALAAAIVALGMLVAAGIYWLADVPLPAVLGLMAGAVTNTPSLAVAEQTLQSDSNIGLAGLGYAVAYPFGIVGILLAMMLIRTALRISIKTEADRFEESRRLQAPPLETLDVVIRNSNLNGVAMRDVPGLVDQGVVASRLKRGERLMVPGPDTLLELGDLLHLVGPAPKLKGMQLVLGEKTDIKLTTKNTDLRWEKVVVTNSKVLGESLAALNLRQLHQVVISRVNRAGVEIAPTPALQLQFGDILNVVGRPDDIRTVSGILGNAQHLLQHTQMIPIFFGIALGVLLGSLPLYLPGVPNALKLGLAGGPLLAAIALSRVGNIGPLVWFMPPSANLVLREFGIILFLAVAGFKSGGRFIEVLVSGDGLLWMGYGALITLLPLLTVGFYARIVMKQNYLTLCGLLAGSSTDPPALAFANGLAASEAQSLAYATVYPLVMCLRILAPQILVMILAGFAA
ncbi:MAG TPA: putative transporter [Xanthomonadaceae bacterium]|nr:putative transporter [Xanthomonadaceae bacterium]